MENNKNNNNYYYYYPKSSQLEEHESYNTQNNNFSNENNSDNIDIFNNFIETVSIISNENIDLSNIDFSDKDLNLFMDKLFYNDNISRLDANTLENLSVYEYEKNNLKNDLNNNKNYNEKRKKFDFKQLIKGLDILLYRAKTELSKLKELKNSEKIKKLETQINKLEDFKNNIKRNENNSTDKNINKNDINELNKKFKEKKKDILNTFINKKTKKGESYKINYPKYNEKNAKILCNNSQNVSKTRKKFQKIYKEITDNSIYESLHSLFNNLNNLFNIFKKELIFQNIFIKMEPKGNNDIEELNITFYHNKLLKTFQVCKNFKKIYDKINSKEFLNNGDDFLKNLYNKYRVTLENKNLIKKILEEADSNKTIPSKYSNTEICKNTNNFKVFLRRRGIKSKNTPFEIKIMFDFIPFMYDIFCLLGYVNEIGEITNPEAQEEMETLLGKTSKKIDKDIIIKELKNISKNSFLKDFSEYLINQLEKKSLTEDKSKINYLPYGHSKLYNFASYFKFLLKNTYNLKIENVSETLEEMLNALSNLYNTCGYLGFVNEEGEITDETAKTYFNTLKNQINLYIDYLNYLNLNKKDNITFDEEYLNSNKYKTSERRKIRRKKNKKEDVAKSNNFNNSPKLIPLEEPAEFSLQNFNFSYNTAKNETSKPNESEKIKNKIDEEEKIENNDYMLNKKRKNKNNNFNINQPKLNQQEELKKLENLKYLQEKIENLKYLQEKIEEELEGSVDSSSQNDIFFDDTY